MARIPLRTWLSLVLLGITWIIVTVAMFNTDQFQSDLWFGRGYWQYNRELYDDALVSFSHAIELNPENTAAQFNRAQLYADLGRYEEALADYGAVIVRYPDYAHAYLERGDTYSMLGMYEQAIRDYTTAISEMPYLSEAYFKRAEAYRALGDENSAAADYATFLEIYGLDDDQAQTARERLRGLTELSSP